MTALAAYSPRARDVHAHLRQATHPTHVRLHGLSQFRRIEAGELPLADYAGLLGALHGFHSSIAALAETTGLLNLSSSPRRLEQLEADLKRVGGRPASAPANPTMSRTAAFGALYVAEGSALGGRVIARRLDYLFGAEAAGRTFFIGDGNTGPAWRRFLAAMQDECGEPALMPALVEAAEATFELFEACVSS